MLLLDQRFWLFPLFSFSRFFFDRCLCFFLLSSFILMMTSITGLFLDLNFCFFHLSSCSPFFLDCCLRFFFLSSFVPLLELLELSSSFVLLLLDWWVCLFHLSSLLPSSWVTFCASSYCHHLFCCSWSVIYASYSLTEFLSHLVSLWFCLLAWLDQFSMVPNTSVSEGLMLLPVVLSLLVLLVDLLPYFLLLLLPLLLLLDFDDENDELIDKLLLLLMWLLLLLDGWIWYYLHWCWKPLWSLIIMWRIKLFRRVFYYSTWM